MRSDSGWSDVLPEVAGATVGALLAAGAGVVFITWQRRNDRAAQRAQQTHDDDAARHGELAEGVIAVWGAATRMMNIAHVIDQRVVQRYRFGQLVGPHLLELGRALGDLIAGYTRVWLSADEDLISAADRVLMAGQALGDAVGGAPWWNPWRARRRSRAHETAFDDMSKALLELRKLTRTKLGRELPGPPSDRPAEAAQDWQSGHETTTVPSD